LSRVNLLTGGEQEGVDKAEKIGSRFFKPLQAKVMPSIF
jgi:hypothetical protein